MPSSRRSGRLSGVRKTYTVDPFAENDLDLTIFGEEDSKTPQNKGKGRVQGDNDSDEEFQAQEEEEEEDPDDDVSEAEDPSAENDGEEVDAAVLSKAEVATSKSRRLKGSQKPVRLDQPRSTKKRRPDGAIVLNGDETHSRGAWNPLEHAGKSIHLQVTFGLDERDLLAVLYTRDRWSRGIDSTFPTRVSLDEAESLRDYKYGLTFGVEPDDYEKEKTSNWDWYYDDDGPGGRFRKRQRIEQIKEQEARPIFLPTPKQGKHTVLMGPAGNQMEFNLNQYEVFNFGDAWGELKSRNQKDASNKKKRQGWVLNIGQRIQCLAWVPNQSGCDQFLSVVAPITNEQKQTYPDPLKDYAAAAFRSSAPYPCALQIWAFKASEDGGLTKTIDMNVQPSLRLLLCTKWGDLRRMAWCPISRKPRDEDNQGGFRTLGLLAGVWGDGYVRVIDVKVNDDPTKTEFCRFCSCIKWWIDTNIVKTESMPQCSRRGRHPQYVHVWHGCPRVTLLWVAPTDLLAYGALRRL